MKTQITSKGLLDIRTISLLGLSAKQDESAIGQFGTGMKYAIAVLLRTGHQLGLKIGEATYEFKTKSETFRGKDFTKIVMTSSAGEIDLPITLEYGKNWQVWMAFRELWSNALDEGLAQQGPNTTTWSVIGQEFADCYAKRTTFFIPEKGEYFGGDYPVHVGDRPSKAIYCKTVRASVYPETFAKTYNVDSMPLTEEREAASSFISYEFVQYVFTYLLATEDFSIFSKDTFEKKLNWNWVSKHRVLPLSKKILEEARRNVYIPNDLVSVALACLPLADRAKKIELDSIQKTQLDRSLTLLRAAGIEINNMLFVEDLPDQVHGMVYQGDIYIAKSAFEMGTAFLAGTIYEEHMHKNKGLRDESRSFQNHLINSLMAAWQHQHGVVL
jgi:hypothetical protein